MAVDVKEDVNTFTASSPRMLFEMRVIFAIGAPAYDVTRDGQRFSGDHTDRRILAFAADSRFELDVRPQEMT